MIAPSDAKVDIDASYTITCGKKFAQSGGTKMTCTGTNVFDTTSSCTS